jgi:hypothetical protein
LVFDLVNNPEVSIANAIKRLLALKFFNAGRAGLK